MIHHPGFLVQDFAASLTCGFTSCLVVVCCSLDLQLSQLEASVAAADAPTLELLGQSTSRWMHADQGAAATAADTHRDAPAALPSDVQSDCQQLHSSSSGMNGCAGAGSRPAVENPSTSSHSLVDDPNTGAKVVSPQPGSSSAAGSSGLSSSPQPSSADGTTTGQQAASAGQEVSFPPSKQQQAANMAALPAQGAGSLPSKA